MGTFGLRSKGELVSASPRRGPRTLSAGVPAVLGGGVSRGLSVPGSPGLSEQGNRSAEVRADTEQSAP